MHSDNLVEFRSAAESVILEDLFSTVLHLKATVVNLRFRKALGQHHLGQIWEISM